MTNIQSDPTLINQNPETVFRFLSNVNNHQQMMPEQVVDWQSDQESCRFTIKGTGALGLRISQLNPSRNIVMVPEGKVPFPFTVNWILEAVGETQTKVRVEMDAEMNMMIRMLAQQPLQNFLNLQVERLQHCF